jgi:hypothetical protein
MFKLLKQATFIFILCLSSFSLVFASQPDWFGALPHENFEIIGYGESENIDDAILMAKKEIAQSIQTQISSENTFEQTVINDKLNKNSNIRTTEKTDVILNDLVELKREKISKKWYIALKYNNLPFTKKFVNLIQHEKLADENQNTYLAQSPLINSLNNELKIKLNYTLFRNDSGWNIGYQNKCLRLNKFDFEKLFYSSPSHIVSVKPSKEDVIEGEQFFFEIKSSQNGLFTILNITENGEVFVIASNRKIKPNNKELFPSPSSAVELIAGLSNKKEPTIDLYVVLLSENTIDLSRITSAKETIQINERNYKFDEALNLMNNHIYSTVILRTSPKS